MPELPEVEVVVRQIRPALLGREIVELCVEHDDVFECFDGLEAGDLAGRKFVAIERRGKLMILRLSGAQALTVHLRMTGHLWLADPADEWQKHTHCIFRLGGGEELRFRDPRRFGRIQYLTHDGLASLPFLQGLGPEPHELGLETLRAGLAGRRGTIKGALLDQHLVAGLGNIYVDEILFRSRLHPELIAGRLKGDETLLLLQEIQSVIEEAVARGGSTISDFSSFIGEPGRFQDAHRVFDRTGEGCFDCGGEIRKIKVVGRGTHVCPTCQPRRRRSVRRTAKKAKS
jgi:formamidopyrimidine-DNA glycosylase